MFVDACEATPWCKAPDSGAKQVLQDRPQQLSLAAAELRSPQKPRKLKAADGAANGTRAERLLLPLDAIKRKVNITLEICEQEYWSKCQMVQIMETHVGPYDSYYGMDAC